MVELQLGLIRRYRSSTRSVSLFREQITRKQYGESSVPARGNATGAQGLARERALHQGQFGSRASFSEILVMQQADRQHEIDQITRRRTAFETSLIRRQTRKDDFFKYAEYEINLEQLRKVRWRRMGE